MEAHLQLEQNSVLIAVRKLILVKIVVQIYLMVLTNVQDAVKLFVLSVAARCLRMPSSVQSAENQWLGNVPTAVQSLTIAQNSVVIVEQK